MELRIKTLSGVICISVGIFILSVNVPTLSDLNMPVMMHLF